MSIHDYSHGPYDHFDENEENTVSRQPMSDDSENIPTIYQQIHNIISVYNHVLDNTLTLFDKLERAYKTIDLLESLSGISEDKKIPKVDRNSFHYHKLDSNKIIDSFKDDIDNGWKFASSQQRAINRYHWDILNNYSFPMFDAALNLGKSITGKPLKTWTEIFNFFDNYCQ